MNRKERRATEKQNRKADKAIGKQSDVAVDSRFSLSGAIQDEVHKALQRLGLGPDDIPVIVHALGMTAAGLACRVGVEPEEFGGKMSLYLTQVKQVVDEAQADEGAGGPSLVMP